MPRAKIASIGSGWVAKRWHLPTIAELAKRGEVDIVWTPPLSQEENR